MESYPYTIDGKRVEFFHWNINKKFKFWNQDEGKEVSISEGFIRAAMALKNFEIGFMLSKAYFEMDENTGFRRSEKRITPNGFTVGVCGDKYAFTFCSEKDQFIKSEGRRIVIERLQKQ